MLRNTNFKDKNGNPIYEGDYLIVDINGVDINLDYMSKYFSIFLEKFKFRYYQIFVKPTEHLQMNIETVFLKDDFTPIYEPEYYYSMMTSQERAECTFEEYVEECKKDKTDKLIYKHTLYYDSFNEMHFHQKENIWYKIDNSLIVEGV